MRPWRTEGFAGCFQETVGIKISPALVSSLEGLGGSHCGLPPKNSTTSFNILDIYPPLWIFAYLEGGEFNCLGLGQE